MSEEIEEIPEDEIVVECEYCKPVVECEEDVVEALIRECDNESCKKSYNPGEENDVEIELFMTPWDEKGELHNYCSEGCLSDDCDDGDFFFKQCEPCDRT